MRTVVVANPESQNGRLGRRWGEVEAAIRGAIGDVAVRHTQAPRHATTLTREALRDGFDDG